MTTHIEPDFVGKDFPLTHPRICGLSVVQGGTISVSTEATGFEGINAADPRTYNYWKPTAVPATFDVTLGSAATLSYLAIYGHNLGTIGGAVKLQKPDGVGGWENIGDLIQPDDDEPILFLFRAFEETDFRVKFSAQIPTVAVIYVGDAIESPVKVYSGIATPANLARKTEFNINRTTGGQYVGRSIKRQLKTTAMPLEHVTEYWVQNTLDPFIEDAITNPYFLAENPHQRPDAVQFKWEGGDILPERMGLKNLMKVTL